MMNAFTHVGRQQGAEKRTFSAAVMGKYGAMIDRREPGGIAPCKSH